MVDDKSSLINKRVNSYKIYDPNKIEFLISKFSITKIFIAIPSLSSEKEKSILDKLINFNIEIKGLLELMIGYLIMIFLLILETWTMMRIFGRKPIYINQSEYDFKFKDKVILVTGGAGSIGSEIVKNLCKLNAKK